MSNFLTWICFVSGLISGSFQDISSKSLHHHRHNSSAVGLSYRCSVRNPAQKEISSIGKLFQPNELFLDFLFDIVGLGFDIADTIESAQTDEMIKENFQNVFGALDRNLQAVNNVQESIDVMMQKSMDSFQDLQQRLNQSTAEIMADIDNVGSKVDRNFGYLLDIFKIASETYTDVEKTRFEMLEDFKQSLAYAKSSRIEPTLSKMNNFITYFSNEKARISQLPREDRIATLKDDGGFLRNLRESRTPTGGSLETFLYEVFQNGYAIPSSSNDTLAYSALSSTYYGVITYLSVMRYLVRVDIYLADHFYRNWNIDEFNYQIEYVTTDFKSFRDTLIGKTSFIDQTIEVLKKVANLGFTDVGDRNSPAELLKRSKYLEQAKLNLSDATTLPVIHEVPVKLMAQFKFDERSLPTPIGSWEDGVKVSYAVQYRDAEGLYSKVGEWSNPFTIKGRAHPRIRVPPQSTYTRVIFRKFNDEMPQFVGVIERDSGNDFRDIDRDLYNAVAGPDESAAIDEASKLIENGANASTTFDLGRSALHAAAMNGNSNLTKTLSLVNSNTISAQDANGYTPLHVAAEGGWADFVELMIQRGANSNAKTKAGSTALHLAVTNGYPDAIQALLKTKEVDVNSQDNNLAGPLHLAVLNGVEDVVETLLADRRTNVNLESNGNLTSLHLSTMIKSPGTTSKLIQAQDIRINARSTGNMTAFLYATTSGNLPALRLLAALDGTDVNAQSVNGWTPLHYAISIKRKEVISELLTLGNLIVDVPGAGQITPLHIAAATDQSDVVKDLLEKGASINLPDSKGLAALHLAAVNKNEAVFTTLILAGADVNARTTNGSTILHLMAAKGDARVVNITLEKGHGVEIDLLNNEGLTAVQLAAINNHQDVMAILLQKGADVNARTTNGSTILHLSAAKGDLEMVKFIVNVGSVRMALQDDNMETPLMLAERFGHFDLAKLLREKIGKLTTSLIQAAAGGKLSEVTLLLSRGACLEGRDGSGSTPVLWAAYNGHLDVVKYLVDRGADINSKRNGGYTVLDWANEQHHTDVADYLRSKGATY